MKQEGLYIGRGTPDMREELLDFLTEEFTFIQTVKNQLPFTMELTLAYRKEQKFTHVQTEKLLWPKTAFLPAGVLL